ncbi:MAG: UDP-3-O-(3-hydroxymyristoyl)glucosamine N-acyltransferase [Acidobacteriota bacterium]|jgi:UDP-3-O-[3-hydroxymyristoyl] glucosamine N-acyltransferase|nr:UDP-3-O-(3-hydroxymyristoyl)glucosamine N-acyltransferase [Acidobacteriota bacterium]
MPYNVRQLASLLALEFRGDGRRAITKVSGWGEADAGSLVFIDGDAARGSFPAGLEPACVLAPPSFADAAAAPFAGGVALILSPNPKLDFAKAALLLHPRPTGGGGRHPTALVAPDAVLGERVELGPYVVVEEGARIGDGTILSARVTVGRGCAIGEDCILHPGVTLYPGAVLGARVVLHAGAVVGADGFGYVPDGGRRWKFPQVGGVVLGDDVEVGANTTIDRGSLGTTRIGEGAKIDNLVQIAHNVEIGRHVVIAAQTGVSGSTVIEDCAVIGGQVGFGDHARVEGGVVIGSKAGVLPGKVVRAGEVYWGVPVRPLREYKRLNALFGRLPGMKAELASLKAELAELKEKLLP